MALRCSHWLELPKKIGSGVNDPGYNARLEAVVARPANGRNGRPRGNCNFVELWKIGAEVPRRLGGDPGNSI